MKFNKGDLLRCVREGSGVTEGEVYVFIKYGEDAELGNPTNLIHINQYPNRVFENRFVLAEETVVSRILTKYSTFQVDGGTTV